MVTAVTLPFGLMKTSLLGLPFVIGLFLAGGLAWVMVGVRPRHRVLLSATAVVMTLLGGAAAVNRYFAYLPSVGAVLGVRAADQVNWRKLAIEAPRITLPVHGSVELVDIPPTASGFRARRAQVYLPPAWFQTPRPALPVIELLHGTPGAPEDWTRAGRADTTSDQYAMAHGGVAPILVMPDTNGGWTRDSECVDTPTRRAETYLTVDVPNWVKANLGAATDRASWAIMGSSEGGYCAVDLGLRHSDQYGTVVDLSGLDRPTFAGGIRRLLGPDPRRERAYDPRVMLRHGIATGPAVWFEVGTHDGANTRSARILARLARRDGLVTRLRLVPGGRHTWWFWRRAFGDALPWTAAHLGLPSP